MRLPPWARTVRVRLAVTYSLVVFGIAALVLAVVYLAVSSSVEAKDLDSVGLEKFYVSDEGKVKFLGADPTSNGEIVSAADLELVQQAVNARTLDTLRTWTVGALAGMFLLSLLVGWWVAGRVLRPIGRITATAREISATDLSRRIAAGGPPDELRTLADTIDGMLDRLDGAFAAQRALVDDVSHELRNPVAVIQANLDAVLSDEAATADNRRRSVAVVTQATASMSRLLEDLLANARHRSGAFTETETTLATLAAAAAEEYRLLAEERTVELRLRLDDGPRVLVDEISLIRALRNLLSNAVRFSPVSGVLSVAVGSQAGWAWLAVRDQGPGIDEEHRERIFERHVTRTMTGGAPASGNGIGLAIARQVVEAHGGRLVVHSTPGAGSTFVVWLPDRNDAAPHDRLLQPPAADPLGPGLSTRPPDGRVPHR